MGKALLFDEGIKKLEQTAKDDWAKSNVAFLKGFNFRLKGNLPKAEEYFRIAYELSPGNLSAARELASVCLARDNLEDAEIFAREAHSHARYNPYLLDILISVLIRRHGKSAKHSSEIQELFDALEDVGEEDGKSFYTTRKAEFEHLYGDNKVALELITETLGKTPHLFDAHKLHAEILLSLNNRIKAAETLDIMQRMVDGHNTSERQSHYRTYLKTRAAYLVEIGRFDEAKKLFDNSNVFTEDEKNSAIKDIEITQGYLTAR